MIWLAKTVNDRFSVVQTLRFQTVKKRFACVSVDMKNAVTTVWINSKGMTFESIERTLKDNTIYKYKYFIGNETF